jgi:L-ascorbate metabolism protein UlaG (beta-lactamase superfamily)
MQNTRFYLKQNVQAEPLFNQWYAWSHLISPHTAAMNIANLHLKIMKSYVAAPQIHASAVKNPEMIGGPFIDYQGGRIDEIKALINKTTKEQAQMIAFAESVKILDDLLRHEAKGFSLEPLYEKVPQNLKGYVELVYDLNNNPSIKFIEGLLYQSQYYNPSSQSLLLSTIDQDDRAFILSTPRLPDERFLELKIPFNHPGVNELFKMKRVPQTLGYIKESLGLREEQAEKFLTFLTEEEPPFRPRYSGSGVRVRYFGHACVLLETKDISILIDPALSYYYENGIERYTYLDLPEIIDYVLVTHSHQDHVMFESLLQIKHKVKNIITPRSRGGCLEDPSLKLMFRMIGFEHVIELEEMERLEIDGVEITGVPFFGEHADLNVASKIAYHIRLKDKSFLFAADSNNLEPAMYEHLSKILGNVDIMFIGMECDGAPMSWLYGPLLTQPVNRKMDQTRRFCGSDYGRGIGIVNQFNCQDVYVYAMGQEPWLTYALSIKYTEESNPIVASNKLVEDCLRRGIASERLFGKKELFYGENGRAASA